MASLEWDPWSRNMYGDRVVFGDFMLISAADMVAAGVGESAWINFCEDGTGSTSYKKKKAYLKVEASSDCSWASAWSIYQLFKNKEKWSKRLVSKEIRLKSSAQVWSQSLQYLIPEIYSVLTLHVNITTSKTLLLSQNAGIRQHNTQIQAAIANWSSWGILKSPHHSLTTDGKLLRTTAYPWFLLRVKEQGGCFDHVWHSVIVFNKNMP